MTLAYHYAIVTTSKVGNDFTHDCFVLFCLFLFCSCFFCFVDLCCCFLVVVFYPRAFTISLMQYYLRLCFLIECKFD